MWFQYGIVDSTRLGGDLRVTVEYRNDDGVHQPYEKTYTLSQPADANWLKRQHLAELARVNGLDANEALVPVGGMVDETPIKVEDVTPEQQAANDLSAARFQLEVLKRDRKPGDMDLEAQYVLVKQLAEAIGQ